MPMIAPMMLMGIGSTLASSIYRGAAGGALASQSVLGGAALGAATKYIPGLDGAGSILTKKPDVSAANQSFGGYGNSSVGGFGSLLGGFN